MFQNNQTNIRFVAISNTRNYQKLLEGKKFYAATGTQKTPILLMS